MTARPLGRHVEHDPRSREYPARSAVQLRTTYHRRHCKPFQQGDLGSCTGNAMVGALMTDGLWNGTWKLTEGVAVWLYGMATRLDNQAGQYPPDDTGSTGLAAAKAAKLASYITGYHHAFGLQHVLGALVLRPCILGTNWYEGFDDPAKTGECRIVGDVRGGHEVELTGIDVENQWVTAVNSWGSRWGGTKDGTMWFSWDTLERLLAEDGDVTVPV